MGRARVHFDLRGHVVLIQVISAKELLSKRHEVVSRALAWIYRSDSVRVPVPCERTLSASDSYIHDMINAICRLLGREKS